MAKKKVKKVKKETKAKKVFSVLVDEHNFADVNKWDLEDGVLTIELNTGAVEIFNMYQRATITPREETPNAI